MLLEEWNLEEAQEVWREEGLEEGMEKGRNQILELMKQGYTVEQIEQRLTKEYQDQG
jgi:hypothetical protein